MEPVAAANEETMEAWNGVLFDRFVQFRPIVTTGLGGHGDEALRRYPPRPGDRVLDIGCGFGDTSQQIAALVGAEGSVLGIDVAERFIKTAREEVDSSGVTNLSFAVGDLQTTGFDQQFDYAFSRFGTMFFANPVVALRNVRDALVPGGRLCMVVWRQKVDNPWLHCAEVEVEKFVTEPEESDEPTCGPGPFSMAGADTTSDILLGAEFEQIGLHRLDLPYRLGADLDSAVAFNMALGPAGEVIRLAGEEAERLRPQIEEALRGVLSQFVQPNGGVVATASTWIVTATVPAS